MARKTTTDALVARAIRLSIEEKTTVFHGRLADVNEARQSLVRRAREARRELRDTLRKLNLRVAVLERYQPEYHGGRCAPDGTRYGGDDNCA